ncbi:MAG: V-type ATPase subunit [Spirochaetes bacterium]|nr:V-type ATPase subunit [Spirochaetota bacterium]
MMTFEFTNDALFSFGVGKIKALETKMITRPIFDQMAEGSLESIYKSIAEYGYSVNLEESILKSKKTTYDLVTHLIEKKERYHILSDLYLLQEDCYNLKNYLKSPKSPVLPFNPLGKISQKDLQEIVNNKRYHLFDKMDSEIAGYYIAQAMERSTPSGIDQMIDTLFLELSLKKIRQSEVDYLNVYFHDYVDLLNIENLLRFKFMKKDFSYFSQFYFHCGSLKKRFLEELYREKIEDIALRFRSKRYASVLQKTAEAWIKDQNLNSFEVEKDNYLNSLARITRLLTFGVEPIFGYLFGKETEYKNLRIIINGKQRKLSVDQIKEMIRQTYV